MASPISISLSPIFSALPRVVSAVDLVLANKMYTKKVMEHFKKPHNYGRMKNPDGIGKVGNAVCGDIMWLYIKVRKDKKGRNGNHCVFGKTI